MKRHFLSKIALAIYIIIAIGITVCGYNVLKMRDGKNFSNTSNQEDTQQITPSTNDQLVDNKNITSPEDNSENSSIASDNNSKLNPGFATTNDSSASKISSEKEISGSVLAHITPQHCENSCQAFAIDLNLLEYCEQACGISPIKKVDNCDNKKDLQKDYCLKDLAITKESSSSCDKIKDANIKQACKNRIAEDGIENMQ